MKRGKQEIQCIHVCVNHSRYMYMRYQINSKIQIRRERGERERRKASEITKRRAR